MLSRLARKVRKFTLGRALRHMAHTHPDFQLTRQGDVHEVKWKDASIAHVKGYQQLKNAYSGCCFIVGSGPSLQDLDIQRIAGFDAMTLNGSIAKYLDAGLYPRHHHMAHRTVFTRHLDYARRALESGTQCFFPYLGISKLCEADPRLVAYPSLYLYEAIDKKHDHRRLTSQQFWNTYSREPGIYMSERFQDRRGTIGFNAGSEHGFFTSNTVSVSAVQLALYMGYRTIFMLGMEYGATGKTYFYNQTPETINDLMQNYDPVIKTCFELAKQAADEQGFEIYNLTPHSLLTEDIIPRLSLEDAIRRAETI